MKQQQDKVTNNPIRSCSNMLKKLFEKELILQFTAFKKSTDRKFVFQQSDCFKISKSKNMKFIYRVIGKNKLIFFNFFSGRLSQSP